MPIIPEEHKKIYGKYGTTPAMHITDGSTGKVLYSDKDLVSLAKWSVDKCGTGFGDWPKIEHTSVDMRCSNCGHLTARFFNQLNGFMCYECNTMNKGLGVEFSKKELEAITECEKGSFIESEQSNCVNKILSSKLSHYNNRYKRLYNGEPLFYHRLWYRLKPFYYGQVKLFKDLFKRKG